MELLIHPKSRKITIEIPEEFVDRDLIIKPKKSLRGRLKVKKTKNEDNAWLEWVRKKYEKS